MLGDSCHLNTFNVKFRSLFVPYFKYLLEGCVQHLTDAKGVNTANSTRKKKKARIQEAGTIKEQNGSLSINHWQLRALVISSLHKCFLYDTASLKFLDSTNFQVSYMLPLLLLGTRIIVLQLFKKPLMLD